MASLTGTSGDDSLQGGPGAETIFGGAGNDTISDAGGADTIYGGSGNDSVSIGDGAGDSVHGGSGDDTILSSGADPDGIWGDAGNDLLIGSEGANLVQGGAGADTLQGGGGADTLDGGLGADNVQGGTGDDLLQGGDGTPIGTTFLRNGGFDSGYDGWIGVDQEINAETNYLSDGLSNPVAEIDGNAGSITTMEQSFEVDAAQGATLTLRAATRLAGQVGTDGFRVDVLDETGIVVGTTTIIPTSNAWTNHALNLSFPGAGTYTLRLTELGNDDSLGTIVDDIQITATSATTDAAPDTLDGGDGNDTLHGGAGADSLLGGAGADSLDGGDDVDRLFGGTGDDQLSGGTGDDTLEGGAGNDTIRGGSGADRFGFGNGGGADVVGDFSMTLSGGLAEDRLDVSALTDAWGNPVKVWDVTVGDDGFGNARLTFPGGESVVLQGVSPALVAQPGMLHAMGVPCFAAGSRIATPGGPRPVERIRPGELVLTEAGAMPVLWHGWRRLSAEVLDARPELRPVRLKAGHFGLVRDLVLSPQHGVALAGGLVRARHLAQAGSGARVMRRARGVTYHHLLLPRHAILNAEGARVESLYPGPEALRSLDPAARLDLLRVLARIGRDYGPRCLPLLPGAAMRSRTA